MAILFYPHEDELEANTLDQRLEILLESAERYKAAILDLSSKATGLEKKRGTPHDVLHAYNWEEIAKLLREIRNLPESMPNQKTTKADKITKLAEIYEVLRGAKMAKLEAVRIALMNEARQLRGTGSQVA